MEYEDRLQISTPEGVELELTLAGVGSRFTASMIDHVFQFALVAACIALLLGVGEIATDGNEVRADDDGDNAALGVAVITIFSFLVFFAYDVLFEVRAGGRTPGKRWTGLRVVRTGGRPVGFVTSATRNVLRVVDILPGFYGLAMASILATPRNQRLGDLAAGTIVVRERTGGRGPLRRVNRQAEGGGWTPTLPALDSSSWDVSAVTGEEITTVRRYLERRATLADAARRNLAADLAARLRPKVAGAPEDAPPDAFLEALATAKAARTAP